MANIMENRINAIMDEGTLQKLFTVIAEITGSLPEKGNLTLNDEERVRINSLDVDNKAFVEDVINEIRISGNGILPAFITADMIQNDLTLFEQMDRLHTALSNTLQRVADLRRIAASEAYDVSTVAYSIYSSAAQSGIPGSQASFDKLKQRYKSNGGGAPAKENP